MDPVNAVGIAAAVVQFADYGLRLIKSAYELYKSPSGQRSEYVELSVVSQDLSSLADAIRSKLDEGQGLTGEVFLRLHAECKSTNDELQSILNKLKVQGSAKIALAADGLRVAFRQVATADDIERLANRLNQIREQMNVGLLYLLLDEASRNGVELRQFAKQQADMIARLEQIDNTTKRFSTDIIGLIDKWPMNHQRETEKMVRYVLSDKWQTSKYAKQTVYDESQDSEKLEYVRQSLHFESISHREQGIPKRHTTTFEWIFHEPQTSEDGHALWSEFPLWLRGESPDIYWITGKPGAGKSTLVKFISREPRFEALLQEWAAESQLLIIRFFSWTSGANRLQKSQEGLFRTLLFEAIQQRPQLVVDIFPARWFLLQSFNGKIKLPTLTMDELRAGFQNLLSATGDTLKLALLIDGLDEFDEDHYEDHRGLVRLLRDANVETGVKICVSSRPWNVFRDEYGKSPTLQLAISTREDIKSFVQEQLQLSPGYRDFADTNQKAADKIITDIVDKSQGVFLWVSVISGLLEAALQEGTSISDLQATIDDLPSKVADLFRYIWNRTSKRFRAEASQYFQLMRFCQKHKVNLFAVTLWFGDKDFSVDFDTANVTSKYLTGVIKTLERRLMSRTGGLLELVYRNEDYAKEPRFVRVDYMHRTANDWVSDNWASITSATDPGFDPSFWYFKGRALSVVHTTKPNASNLMEVTNWPHVCHIASLISEDCLDKGIFVTVLDRVDHHLVSHIAEDISHLSSYWADRVIQPSNDSTKLKIFRSTLKQLTDSGMLDCASFIDFSARIPIPTYFKHKAQENPDTFSSTADGYGRILNNLIFGEIWYRDSETRLNLLDFLIQETDCPPMELFRIAMDKAEEAATVAREVHSADHYLVNYFTQVKRILGSQIPNHPAQPTSWLERSRYWWQSRRRRYKKNIDRN